MEQKIERGHKYSVTAYQSVDHTAGGKHRYQKKKKGSDNAEMRLDLEGEIWTIFKVKEKQLSLFFLEIT